MGTSQLWRRAVVVGFAFALALVEYVGVVGSWHPLPAELRDAFFSAALVYALFGTVLIVAGLIPSHGPARFLAFLVFQLVLALLSGVLFVSWIVRWMLGQPLNGDAVRVLIESPVASILQLRQSDPMLLAVLTAGLLLFLWACGRMLAFSAGAWSGGRVTSRALVVVVCVLVAGLSSWQVASAKLTWSSYAAVVLPHVGSDEIPNVYSCPAAPKVALTARPVGTASGTPVIVIVLESMRADLLREHADAIPFLSSLARESVVFDKAYSSSTHSDFADLSIWYSRYALYSDTRLGYPANASWRGTSVFEYFKDHGYRTGYFSSQDERWGEMINWMKLPSLDAFFDADNFVDPDVSPRDAAQFMSELQDHVTDSGKVPDDDTLLLAGDWLERHRDQPVLLGMNLQNTHFAYFTPKGSPEPFMPADRSVRDLVFAWPAERKQAVLNRYLNAAFNVDAALARFARRMQDAGIWDRAIVLITGDHGEAFHEHGYATHGGPAFEEVARTFAILKLPKGSKLNGSTFTKPVSNVDFVPMLVQWAGMPEWPGFQGHSPFASSPAVAPIFLTVNGLTRGSAVVEWPWKLMSRLFPTRSLELYNLEADPAERQNVVREDETVAVRLNAKLEEWRTCQISYYADRQAHTSLQPPRY